MEKEHIIILARLCLFYFFSAIKIISPRRAQNEKTGAHFSAGITILNY